MADLFERRQVSSLRENGSEIVYLAPDGRFMSIPVAAQAIPSKPASPACCSTVHCRHSRSHAIPMI
jgi:hypothetical protein